MSIASSVSLGPTTTAVGGVANVGMPFAPVSTLTSALDVKLCVLSFASTRYTTGLAFGPAVVSPLASTLITCVSVTKLSLKS